MILVAVISLPHEKSIPTIGLHGKVQVVMKQLRVVAIFTDEKGLSLECRSALPREDQTHIYREE